MQGPAPAGVLGLHMLGVVHLRYLPNPTLTSNRRDDTCDFGMLPATRCRSSLAHFQSALHLGADRLAGVGLR